MYREDYRSEDPEVGLLCTRIVKEYLPATAITPNIVAYYYSKTDSEKSSFSHRIAWSFQCVTYVSRSDMFM